MHPDFESNLITHIFRKFGVSQITGSDVIFAFVEASKEFQRIYFIHSTASSLSMLIFSWNKIFYLLMNVLHHHYVIDEIINQTIAFSSAS